MISSPFVKEPREPGEVREELWHDANLWADKHHDGTSSQHQAQFVASLWASAFEGTSKEKSQAYHSCLDYVWGVDSATNLGKAEAHVTIDWLFSGEYIENDRGKSEPVLNENAIKETRLILREALKKKGQQELL